jgi:hypothetical protein
MLRDPLNPRLLHSNAMRRSRYAPALARSTVIAGHMGASAVQTSMVNFSTLLLGQLLAWYVSCKVEISRAYMATQPTWIEECGRWLGCGGDLGHCGSTRERVEGNNIGQELPRKTSWCRKREEDSTGWIARWSGRLVTLKTAESTWCASSRNETFCSPPGNPSLAPRHTPRQRLSPATRSHPASAPIMFRLGVTADGDSGLVPTHVLLSVQRSL